MAVEPEDEGADFEGSRDKLREDLLAKLNQLWHQSTELARHVADVVALRNEIDDVRKDRTFLARNLTAWRAIVDTRDAVILDLVSFGKALYRDERPQPKAGDPPIIKKRRGVLSDIACNESARALLCVGQPSQDVEDEYVRHTVHADRKARYASLFPRAAKCGEPHPSQQDLLDLGILVRNEYEKIRDNRNGIGHRYEHSCKGGLVHDFDALIDIADQYQFVVTTSMLVVSGNGYSRENTDRGRRSLDAQELVDLAVFGSAGFMERQGERLGAFEYPWQRRAALYEFMHKKSKELGVEAINAPEVFQALPPHTQP